MPGISTADLCDAHRGLLRVAEPVLRNFGAREAFHGPIATLRVFEDNVLVRTRLEQPGGGSVLVVDGGGSTRCALLGDRLAGLARDNAWAGVVINGCVRDVAALRDIGLGIRALSSAPCASNKTGAGEADVAVRFAGIRFIPGEFLYADADGIVVAPRDLTAAPD